MDIPDWIKNAIFYQIFPDRFYNGDTTNDPEFVQAWGEKPNLWDFQGGDLKGIIQKIDYLVELGINAIYLNPIFYSASNHRYDTIDYYRIDPKLGNLDTFHELIDIAHKNELKVILDGVFNHTGRGFFAFNDILENGVHSTYRNWYHIYHFPVDAYSPGKADDYLAWWGLKNLPKLNTDHPPVRKYLLEVARYWIEQGADGWRLDVPNEIDDDSFWLEFRKTVRAANSNAYIVGEIWEADNHWVGNEHFDGLMNYPIRSALIDLLNGKIVPSRFLEEISNTMNQYPPENQFAMFNVLGSHDTERIRTILNDDLKFVELAYTFIFTFIGAPVIYYGDEIGIKGGKDPECRRAFPWDPKKLDWKLKQKIQKLIHLRRIFPTLKSGKFVPLNSDDKKMVFAFARELENDTFIMVFNCSNENQRFQVSISDLKMNDTTRVNNLFGEEYFTVNKKSEEIFVTIPSKTGLVLH